MRTIPGLNPKARHLIAALYGLVGFLVVVTGWGYLPFTRGPAELPKGLTFSTALFPLWVWGSAWVVAGAITMVAAVLQLRRRWFSVSVAAMAFVSALWFCFYAWAYFAGDHRAYVAAAVYGREPLLLGVITILIAVLRPKVTR